MQKFAVVGQIREWCESHDGHKQFTALAITNTKIHNTNVQARGMKGTLYGAGGSWVQHTSTTRKWPDIHCLCTTDFVIDITHGT